MNRKDNSSEDKSNYKKVEVGDIAYNSMRMWQGASGYSLYSGILSPAYTVITPRENINSRFFSYDFKRHSMIQMFKRNSQGLTSDTWNLKYPTLKTIKVSVPILEEQDKISDFFSNLDQLITLQQCELESLKEAKKTLLSKMFPKKGETIPEVRFPGFTDAWEQRKFFDNIEQTIDFRGRTPKKLGLDWTDSGYLALSALNVKPGRIDLDADPHYGNQELYDKWMSGKELRKGQVLFTTEAPMGNVAQVPDNKGYILSQRTIAFDVKEGKITDNFLAVLLGTPKVFGSLLSLSSGGTAKGISQKSLSQLDVQVPKSTLEQEKVSIFFKELEKNITLQQCELESLKEAKKTLLSKMFPKKGETIPEVRFPGFTDAWEQRKLSGLCKLFTDGDWIESKDQSDSGIRLIQTGNIGITKYVEKQNKKWISEDTFKRLKCVEVFQGDILISRLPAPAGRACILPKLDFRAITAVDCTIIRVNDDIDVNYLVQFLSTPNYFNKIQSYLGGGTRQRISRSNLADINVLIPFEDEQQSIGSFFSTLDNLITLQQRKLELLKMQKQTLLKLMFPR